MTSTPAMTSNDPRDLDGKRLQLAMQTLGRDPAMRARMIALLRECEGQIAFAGSVRDEVVGPIIDALHLDTDQYDKVLAENERLRAEVQRALEDPTQNEHDLYAENERLRAALGEMADALYAREQQIGWLAKLLVACRQRDRLKEQ